MTSHPEASHGTVMPFQRYLNATHAARDQYLATTYTAHRMYLTGPWPDRAAYQQVENTAWQVYYTAAREAWQRYAAEVATRAPLPARTPGDTLTRDAAGEVWPTDPPPMPDPRPGPQEPIPPSATGNTWWPNQPTYTPTDGGNQ